VGAEGRCRRRPGTAGPKEDRSRGPDRERRIYRARYAAIARETAILSAQHLYRFDEQRRLATLVVFAREMEVELTDAALTMLGSGEQRNVIQSSGLCS
jgi:hypothetical protein